MTTLFDIQSLFFLICAYSIPIETGEQFPDSKGYLQVEQKSGWPIDLHRIDPGMKGGGAQAFIAKVTL